MAQGDGINPNYNLSGVGFGITGSPYVDSSNPFMAMGRPYAADMSDPALAPHMQPYSDSLVKGLVPLPEMEGPKAAPIAAPNVTRTPAAPQSGFSNLPGMVTPQQIQSMIAPYQTMAQKAFPTNPIFGNDAFQAAHPRVAGAISNFLLAASMTKPGMTVGENISNAAGGILGARQFGREQQLRQAMFPYQMLNTQLAPQEMLTRMYQQGQMGRYYGIHGDMMAGAQTQYLDARAEAARGLATSRGTKTDIDSQGNPWALNPTTFQREPVGWTPPSGYVPKFAPPGSRAASSGISLAQAITMRQSPDQAVRAMGNAVYNDWVGVSGAKAGAEATAKEPTVQENALVANAKTTALEQWKADKPPNNPADWALSTSYKGKDLPGDYQKAQKAWNDELEAKMNDVTKYQTSGTARKGITHSDWSTAQQGQVPSDIPTNHVIYKNGKPTAFMRGNVRVDLNQ